MCPVLVVLWRLFEELVDCGRLAVCIRTYTQSGRTRACSGPDMPIILPTNGLRRPSVLLQYLPFRDYDFSELSFDRKGCHMALIQSTNFQRFLQDHRCILVNSVKMQNTSRLRGLPLDMGNMMFAPETRLGASCRHQQITW